MASIRQEEEEPEVRRVITGLDTDGRSCVVDETALSIDAEASRAGVIFSVVAETDASPPRPRPPGRGMDLDVGVGPGLVRWVVLTFEPNLFYPMHHTDTIDFDEVVDGSVVLGLDDGDHPLAAGDLVVVNGVDHTWKAGPEGCQLNVLQLGSTPFA